jgi:hypothetical protein
MKAPMNSGLLMDKQERAMRIDMRWLELVRRWGQRAGPYLMLELLLPGGTLMALLLFALERRRPDIATDVRRAILAWRRRLASGFQQAVLAPAAIKGISQLSKSSHANRLWGER